MEREPAGVGGGPPFRVLGGKDGSETQLQLHPMHTLQMVVPKIYLSSSWTCASNLTGKVTPGASLRVPYCTHGERHRGPENWGNSTRPSSLPTPSCNCSTVRKSHEDALGPLLCATT